jgi:hypothetical protein
VEFNIIGYEVDGSLSNPVVATSVALWSAALSGMAWLVVRWIYAALPASAASLQQRKRVGLGVMILGFLATHPVQFLLAVYFFHLSNEMGPLDSVGFEGGPPIAPAWVAAAVACVAAAIRENHRLGQVAESPK